MTPEKKISVSIGFPGVPAPPYKNDVVFAMGRLAMAWSSSEFYLALFLQRLMSIADLSTPDKIREARRGNATMISDTNAVFSLYFAVESSRGRRKMVFDLADIRKGEGYLEQQSHDAIKALLDEHGKIGRVRNKYAHVAMGQAEDGSYILLDGDLILFRTDRPLKLRSPKIRANNNTVQSKMIDEVTARLDAWIQQAQNLLTRIATSVSPSSIHSEDL